STSFQPFAVANDKITFGINGSSLLVRHSIALYPPLGPCSIIFFESLAEVKFPQNLAGATVVQEINAVISPSANAEKTFVVMECRATILFRWAFQKYPFSA